ncbi:hypothetical protein AcW1_005483 [Taiwanofungus camphoratus]|nr:hypothetical protein AcW1_005483 [Antrodia cinnamomea]
MSDPQGYTAPAQVDPRQVGRQGPNLDGQYRMPTHRHTQDDAYPRGPPHESPENSNSLMHHQNHSVPSLPSQPSPDEQLDSVPPMPPPYEVTDMFNSFNNMRISDPTGRGNGPPFLNAGDPVPRAATSMSMHSGTSAQSPYHMAPRPSLPASPDHAVRRMPPGRALDASSVHSGGSGSSPYNSAYSDAHDSLAYDGSVETDGTSTYSHDDPALQYPPNGFAIHDGTGAYPPHRGYPPPNWQGQHPGYVSHPPPPPQNQYNPLYAAASNVLGMGPPPGAMPPAPSYMPQQYYANNMSAPRPPSQAAPYLGRGPYQPGPPSNYPGSSQTSLARDPSITPSIAPSAASSAPSNDEEEFERRPALHRSGTTASVNLRTQKTKAIDLSAPPFTKEYIDEYRQRIKDDPDPEAHFQYAKYLIEAAKKFGADAKDQRNVKKYRDTLIAESLKVVRRLATQGQAYDEAQFFLANCHGTGMLGLPVDHERAYHLYLQAAKQNHAAACYRVAVCNEIGAGTRREPQRALAFYRKAASLGDTAAMYKLGVILLRGSLGEQPNPRESVGWLKRAAEQADEENPHALHELALLYEAPNSGVVPYDPAYAKELYTRAGHLGYTHSQYKLGQCHEYGSLTCPVDPRRSIAWYTKAAEKGHSEAELALSGWYLTGSEGVLKQSDSEAYLWARRAANKGLSKAEYAVGYYAEVGIGIKQDIEFAKRWYMRAAAQGNKRAMNRLTEMKRSGNKRANMARPTRQEAKDECVIG